MQDHSTVRTKQRVATFVAALIGWTIGGPAQVWASPPLPEQIEAARAAAFAEADANGDGALDADERAVFNDLFRDRLQEMDPDAIDADGAGTDVYWFHEADPNGGPDRVLHFSFGAGDDPEAGAGPVFTQKLDESGEAGVAGEAGAGRGFRVFVPNQ